MKSSYHLPVLLEESINGLKVYPKGVYVDATFGGGGYSKAILDKATCMVWAIDRDPDAVARAAKMSEPRFTILRGNFGNMENLLTDHRVERLNGIVMDLGVSSPQIDDAARGFSFRYDGPLDMRMNPETGEPASAWLAKAEVSEMTQVFRRYGELNRPDKLAHRIASARQEGPLNTTHDLIRILSLSLIHI